MSLFIVEERVWAIISFGKPDMVGVNGSLFDMMEKRNVAEDGLKKIGR